MQRLKQNFLTTGSCITLAVFLVLHTGWVSAGEGKDETVACDVPAGQLETAAQSPIAAQGMRVYRDPQTGRLGPRPPGAAQRGLTTAEQHMLNRSDKGLRPRTLPGGGVAVDLQGRYRSMAVATVGADGKAAVNCTLTPAQAAAALQAGEQATAEQAE